MKLPIRMTALGCAAVAIALLTTGCPDKVKNLKLSADEAERELKAIQGERDAIQAKTDKIAGWEVQIPKPDTAITITTLEIGREQTLATQEQQQFQEKLKAINEQLRELNDVEWGEVLQYATNALPLLLDILLKKYGLLALAQGSLNTGIQAKFNQHSSLMAQQMALVNSVHSLPPGPTRDAALDQLNTSLAQASQLSFDTELKAVGFMSELFGSVGCLPVMAGSLVPQTTITIQEGLPSSLAHLDSGVLAPGTEIMLQLPSDWSITAPVTAVSSNLEMQIIGNVPGTNAIKIRVMSELTPGLTNDSISVTFHGIRIGQTTGLRSSCMFVYPGRSQKVDFCVLPDPPPTISASRAGSAGIGLSWEGRGTLQRGGKVEGPYTNSPNQSNPQTLAPVEPAQFFRVSRP